MPSGDFEVLLDSDTGIQENGFRFSFVFIMDWESWPSN